MDFDVHIHEKTKQILHSLTPPLSLFLSNYRKALKQLQLLHMLCIDWIIKKKKKGPDQFTKAKYESKYICCTVLEQ